MPHFCLSPRHPFDGDTYWVLAETPGEARRLVARNVPEATAAQTEARFACVRDTLKTPPDGLIFCRLQGPVTIKRR